MAKNTQRLKYLGPVSTFSVVTPAPKGSDKGSQSKDRPLITGQTYDDLPTTHPVIKNLIAQKLLIPDETVDPKEEGTPK